MTRVLHVRCFRMYSKFLISWATKALPSIRISVSIWAFVVPTIHFQFTPQANQGDVACPPPPACKRFKNTREKKRTITEKDWKIEASFSNTTWNPWKFQFPVPSTLSPYRIPHKGPRWVWWPLSYHPTRPDGRSLHRLLPFVCFICFLWSWVQIP